MISVGTHFWPMLPEVGVSTAKSKGPAGFATGGVLGKTKGTETRTPCVSSVPSVVSLSFFRVTSTYPPSSRSLSSRRDRVPSRPSSSRCQSYSQPSRCPCRRLSHLSPYPSRQSLRLSPYPWPQLWCLSQCLWPKSWSRARSFSSPSRYLCALFCVFCRRLGALLGILSGSLRRLLHFCACGLLFRAVILPNNQGCTHQSKHNHHHPLHDFHGNSSSPIVVAVH